MLCSVGSASCILISALSLIKLLIIKFPLRAISFSVKTAHFFYLGILVYCTCAPVLEIMTYHGIFFSYIDYSCGYSQSRGYPTTSIICNVLVGFTGITIAITTVVSSGMLIAAVKSITDRGPGGKG